MKGVRQEPANQALRQHGSGTDEDTVYMEDNIKSESTFETLTSCRWIVLYMCCFCYLLVNAMRNCATITMVCMIKETNKSADLSKEYNSTLQDINNSGFGEIEWDKKEQGYVLSAFYLGYVFTQAPSGALAGRFGGKRVLLIGQIILTLATILTPLAARFNGRRYDISAVLVIILRVISGMATGAVGPSVMNIIGQWFPKYERSKATALLYSGDFFGNILVLGLGGFLCEWKSLDGGWPTPYYLTGGLSVVFCIMWLFLGFNSPAEHPRISRKELNYINYYNDSAKGGVKNQTVPWRQILRSPAVWAITVASMTSNFGFYITYTKLPAYMKEVLGLDIKSNGLYSTLPYIAMILASNPYSFTIDQLRQKQIFSTLTARRLSTVLAMFVPIGFLIGAGYIPGDERYLGIIFMTAAVMFMSLRVSGYCPNTQDIAARYSGEIYGVTNTFAAATGVVAPILVNSLTPNGTIEEWRSVFYVLGVVLLIGGVFFLIFARGETQEWAKGDTDTEKDKLIKGDDDNDGYSAIDNK